MVNPIKLVQTKVANLTYNRKPLERVLKNTTRAINNPEFKQIQAMNIAAQKGIKMGGMPRPKAIDPEDIKLLSSDAAEMVKRWTSWVDPKSGKIYTIINKADNTDGSKLVRVLNESGELVVEKNIKPKKIVIIDEFYDKNNHAVEDFFESSMNFEHGDVVKKHLERNNPIADIECFKCNYNKGYDDINECLSMLLKRIENGEKIDVINCSFGNGIGLDNKDVMDPVFKKILLRITSKETAKEMELLGEITKKGTRVVMAAGNDGEDVVNKLCLVDGVDVVGALNRHGRASCYTGSRSLAKHYERGFYDVTEYDDGINITGKPGIDVKFEEIFPEAFKNGKPKDFEAPMIYRPRYYGTSFATPIRSAKIALNMAMDDILGRSAQI